MIQFKVITLKKGFGRNASYRHEEMNNFNIEFITIHSESEYKALLNNYINEFIDPNSSIFSVHVYNDKGLLKMYQYIDFVDAEEGDPRIIPWSELKKTEPLVAMDTVEILRKGGLNV